MNRRHVLSVFLSFIAGVVVAIFAPRLVRSGIDRTLFPIHRREITRSTSPDGTVDAVLESVDCGVPCASEYSVSIVPKGSGVPTDTAQYVFSASDVVSPKTRWKQPHLLEVAYDRALIDNFRNVTYPLEGSGTRKVGDMPWRFRWHHPLLASPICGTETSQKRLAGHPRASERCSPGTSLGEAKRQGRE
jgi:hypothetical protein